MAEIRTTGNLPPLATNQYQDINQKRLAERVNLLASGRLNVVGELTLDANAASTVFNDPLFAVGAAPLLIPTTANAAAEIGAGTIYLSNRAAGSFTYTHANNAQTDRTFLYVRIG